MAARTNTELLANLGNFCHRALSFASAKLGGVVPKSAAEVSAAENAHLSESEAVKAAAAAAEDLSSKVAPLAASYLAAMEKARLREGARLLMVRFEFFFPFGLREKSRKKLSLKGKEKRPTFPLSTFQ